MTTKRYHVEFVSMVTEKYTAWVEVPDHIADDDLRDYLQIIIDGKRTEFSKTDLIAQDVLGSYLTFHEEAPCKE